jgi:hypothetical protein
LPRANPAVEPRFGIRKETILLRYEPINLIPPDSSIFTYEKEYSQHAKIIMKVVALGYSFDFERSVVVTPKNTTRPIRLYGKQRYPALTVNIEGVNKSFHIHKFVGYLLYGEIALRKGVNVRHLNDNRLDLRIENIAVGTSQDNNLDKSKEKRVRMACHARSCQDKRPHNRKITDQQAEEILKLYLKLKGANAKAPAGTIKRIQEIYKFTRSSIQSICIGKSFPDLYRKVLNSNEH